MPPVHWKRDMRAGVTAGREARNAAQSDHDQPAMSASS
jgi:hypothetical protein